MPGVYKLKICPVCSAEHRKRGPYCSRSHAAQDRTVSAETKAKLSESGLKRYEDKSSEDYQDTVANLRQKQQHSLREEILHRFLPDSDQIDRVK